jgi:hypothetical protein
MAVTISDWENQVAKSGEGCQYVAHGLSGEEKYKSYINEKKQKAESKKWEFWERWADKGRAAHAIEDRRIHSSMSHESEGVFEGIDMAPGFFLLTPLDPTGLLIPLAGLGTFFAAPLQLGNMIQQAPQYEEEFYGN